MTKVAMVVLFWPLGLLAQSTAPASAGSDGRPWNELAGDKLAALNLKGDIGRGEKAYKICQRCHKPSGTGSMDGAYPRLAGQHVTVLIEQITDIRSGKRYNPKMLSFVDEEAMTIQEIADVAAYLTALPIPPYLSSGSGTALVRGNELYVRDCARCHGNKGEGNADKFFPQVGGQHFNYVLRELRSIRDESRGNANPDMVKIIKPYSDQDLETVADYISRILVLQAAVNGR
jgi:cytochrome c553